MRTCVTRQVPVVDGGVTPILTLSMSDSSVPEKDATARGAGRSFRRRWPFGVILAIAAGAVVFVLATHWRQRQDQNIALAVVVVSAFLLLLLAWLFLSG